MGPRRWGRGKRERDERKAILAYRQSLTERPLADLQTEALAQAGEQSRRAYESVKSTPEFSRVMLSRLTDDSIRRRGLHRRPGPA